MAESYLGWPYGTVTAAEVRDQIGDMVTLEEVPSRGLLLLRTLITLGYCLVPIYGIAVLGWDMFVLLVFIFCEGLLALAADLVRIARQAATQGARHWRLAGLWCFQAVFLIFVGLIMLFAHRPEGLNFADPLAQTTNLLGWTLAAAAVFQVITLASQWQTLAQPIEGSPLGASLYLLLMFVTPFVAALFMWTGNPDRVGLLGAAAARLVGQSAWVWAVPILLAWSRFRGRATIRGPG